MHSCIARTLVLAAAAIALHGTADAQVAAGDLGDADFLGSRALASIQGALPSWSADRTKSNPVVVSLPFGTLYAFMHRGDPLLVVAGSRPIDLAASIALPADQLTLNDFIWVYSKKGATLQVSDFPSELASKLQKFWLLSTIQVLEKGHLLRAEPDGDILEALRGFLMLDRISGTTVLAITKNRTVKTTQVMLNGVLANPFGMEMTLTDPLLSYTKKTPSPGTTASPGTTIGLASDVTIKGHAYQLQAEGDVKLRKPELFVLKTTSMKPDDVVAVVQALSKPLFPASVGTMPPWTLVGIPSFELKPVRRLEDFPQNFPRADASKVVVYAATTDKPEWGIKGPALKILGSLAVQTRPAQDIAIVAFSADAASLQAQSALASFTLPGSDLSFGEASATITATARGASFHISAATSVACVTQRFRFAVGTDGVPRIDLNADATMKAMTPIGLASAFSSCAKNGLEAAKYVMRAGTTIYGFTNEALAKATVPVFGEDVTLQAAGQVFGEAAIPALGKAANIALDTLGAYWKKSLLARLGREPDLISGLRINVDEYVRWHAQYSRGVDGFLTGMKGLFPDDEVLKQTRRLFDLSPGGSAAAAKHFGYAAQAAALFLKGVGVSKSEIAKALSVGGYAKDETIGAIASVYGVSAKAAEDLWDDAKDASGKACRTVLGWTKLC